MAIHKSFDWNSGAAHASPSVAGPTVALNERAITILGQQGFVILCGVGFSFDENTKIKKGTITAVYSYLTKIRKTDSVDELLECVSNISVPLALAQTIPCVQDFLDKDVALRKLIPRESEIPAFAFYSSDSIDHADDGKAAGAHIDRKRPTPYFWKKFMPKGIFAKDVFWIDLAILLLVVCMSEALYFTANIFGYSITQLFNDAL